MELNSPQQQFYSNNHLSPADSSCGFPYIAFHECEGKVLCMNPTGIEGKFTGLTKPRTHLFTNWINSLLQVFLSSCGTLKGNEINCI